MFGLAIGQAQERSVENSSGVVSEAPCYRIRHVLRSAPDYPREVMIVISLDPRYFTRDDMMSLAFDLRKLYPSEVKFGAIILDDDNAALYTSALNRTDEYMRARRGLYYRDRTAHKEFIQFSTQRGKPWDEVKINPIPKT